MIVINDSTGLSLLTSTNEDFDASHVPNINSVNPASGLLGKQTLDAIGMKIAMQQFSFNPSGDGIDYN
jgi:hypothetical protein